MHRSTAEECPVNNGYIRVVTPSSKVLLYTMSDNITISISGAAPTTQQNLVYTAWYFNGLSLPFGTSLSSLVKLPTGISQTLRINNPTYVSAGTYEALLLLNPFSYLLQFECLDYRHFFNFIGGNAIIVDQISIDLQYNGELILGHVLL